MVQEAIRNSSWEGVYNATAPNPVSCAAGPPHTTPLACTARPPGFFLLL